MLLCVILAFLLFVAGAIGSVFQKEWLMFCVAAGLALVVLSELWPHLGLH